MSTTTFSTASHLKTYLEEIDATRLLSAQEERQLAERIREGDVQARDHMVRANLRLVVKIARGYPRQGLEIEDLIAEGNLGLMRAAEGFDPAMNTRFSTYASYWIKQSMRRAIINTGKAIRIPAYMNQLLIEWRRAAAKLQDALGRSPTSEEVAKRLKMPLKKLRMVEKAIRIYNATPVTEQPDGQTIEETLLDPNVSSPETGVADADELQQVLRSVDLLEEREAAVIKLRFGLAGEKPLLLKEIGERLGLTRERVRQIETAALKKLSERLDQYS